MWKKVFDIKKALEIKSYHFVILFFRNFFLAPVWFYTKKSPENCSLVEEIAWEQPWKKGTIDIKNTSVYIQYADTWKKSHFYENVPRLRTFLLGFFGDFFRTLVPVILFSENLFGPMRDQEYFTSTNQRSMHYHFSKVSVEIKE